jgi:hypothetical protein
MKKFILITFLFSSLACTQVHAAINEKVMSAFTQSFPQATNVKWYEDKDHYEVYFDKDDIKCRIDYDFDGNVLNTRRDYLEKDLNPFIKTRVLKEYNGKSIYGITEITSADEMYYIIILQDNRHWYHVKSDVTGQMAIVERYNKAAQ